MKIKYGAVLLAVVALLSGCKGFWDAPASTSTNPTTPTTLSSGVFYVLNQTTGQIVAYEIATGSLNTIGTYSVPGPNDIAVAPKGNYLYVSTLTNGIFVYNIGSGGALTLGSNGQAISSDPALAITVDTGNSWLIDAFINVNNQVQLDATPLNSSGTYPAGANVPSVSFSISNATVKQMVLSPQGDYLFLALGSGGAIAVPFDSGSSSPFGTTATTLTTPNSQQAVLSVAVDPNERIFYLGETNASPAGNSGGLLAFSYSSLTTGPLKQISGSPIASGAGSPSAILPEASGDYVYVANGQGDTGAGKIAWFPITASTTSYSIAAGSTTAAGIFPVGLAEDNEDHFVLAVSSGGTTSSGNPDLEAYTMSSGKLTAAITAKTGTDPVGAIAVAALPQ